MEHLIISDIPTPWREPVFERVHQKLGGAVEVVYFNGNEKRRLWTFRMGSHPKRILKAFTITTGDTERFLNPGLVPLLFRSRPRVALVFTCIKDPSGWIAMGLCRLLGAKVALLDDSWLGRDRQIVPAQRWARNLVYNYLGDAFVGSSVQTLAMFRHYNSGIRDEQCFLSHLVAENDYFEQRLAGLTQERRFDVMFSGRIVQLKNPLFFADVCGGIRQRLGRCNVLIIGDGESHLKKGMREVLERSGVSSEFAGFIPHAELPDYYAQARLLLLPTSADCWGVVLNEAMLAGTPVITTQWTAAAGELVLDGRNGCILPLDVDAWVSAATLLLTDDSKWTSYSQNARESVSGFNYDTAAQGILDAFEYLRAQR